jgi:hypothetical protein
VGLAGERERKGGARRGEARFAARARAGEKGGDETCVTRSDWEVDSTLFFLKKKKPRHSNNYYEVSATNSMLVSFNFNFCFTSCAYKSLNAPLFVSISFPKSVSKLVN